MLPQISRETVFFILDLQRKKDISQLGSWRLTFGGGQCDDPAWGYRWEISSCYIVNITITFLKYFKNVSSSFVQKSSLSMFVYNCISTLSKRGKAYLYESAMGCLSVQFKSNFCYKDSRSESGIWLCIVQGIFYFLTKY